MEGYSTRYGYVFYSSVGGVDEVSLRRPKATPQCVAPDPVSEGSTQALAMQVSGYRIVYTILYLEAGQTIRYGRYSEVAELRDVGHYAQCPQGSKSYWLEITQVDFHGVDNRGLKAPLLIRELGDIRC